MSEGSAGNTLKMMGLALALPSTILGVAYLIYYLTEQKIISEGMGLVILISVVGYFFFLMVRYALNKK